MSVYPWPLNGTSAEEDPMKMHSLKMHGLAVAIVLVSISASVSAATIPSGPLVYEDRNDNGVYDAGDVDHTSAIEEQRASGYFDFFLKASGTVVVNRNVTTQFQFSRIEIEARKIVVLASITMTTSHNTVSLTAKELHIADGVTINVRAWFDARIDGPVLIGNNVKIVTIGDSASGGFGSLSLEGDSIQAGSNFIASGRWRLTLKALDGALATGPRANISSPRELAELYGKTGVNIEGGTIRALTFLTIDSEGDQHLQGTRMSISRGSALSGGYLLLASTKGTVDYSPTLISKPYCVGVFPHRNCYYPDGSVKNE